MLEFKVNKPCLFADLVDQIWVMENPGEAIQLQVPPNQYVSLIIPLGRSSYSYEDRLVRAPQLEGVSLKNTTLSYPAGTKLLGIRFYAFGSYPFFQVPGKQLINNSMDCPVSLEQFDILKKRIDEGGDALVVEAIEALLQELIEPKAAETIRVVRDFYQHFRWNDEASSIDDYCLQTGTNYTSLNRKFSRIVGISPKKIERLIKFRKSLCQLIDSPDKLTEISVNSGYFDQAHFIREFKLFLNHTPSEYQSLIKLADRETQIVNYNFRLL